MRDKKTFLEENGITEKFENLEKHNPDLWRELLDIDKGYANRKHSLEEALNGFVNSIGESEHIHSIRTRIKRSDSLLVKIVEKKFENTTTDSKYNQVTADNYFKILTDLIGVRIIIRYRSEWKEIHKMIWEKYYLSNRSYLSDYEQDYIHTDEAFIAEKPIVYYRDWKEKTSYEIFGLDVFDTKLSVTGYSSIHYIINYNGEYIELQVRTIYDEAWSECDHDFVYKLNAGQKKLVLKRCSKILSDLTIAADSLSTFIRDYYTNEIYNQSEDDKNLEVKETKGENFKNPSAQHKKSSKDIVRVSDVLEFF